MKITALSIIFFVLVGCVHPRHSPGSKQQEVEQNILRQKLLSHYKNWRGTPHQWGGSSHQGIDCSAYTQKVYSEIYSLQLPRTSKQQKKVGNAVAKSKMRTGDLLFFSPRLFSGHVGIYLGDGSFIHVSTKKGVMRSRIDQGYWKKHFKSARRLQN